VDAEGSTAVKACSEGSYQTGTGYTGCMLCRAGTYQSMKAQSLESSCLGCGAGRYTTAEGETNSSACLQGSIEERSGISSQIAVSAVVGVWLFSSFFVGVKIYLWSVEQHATYGLLKPVIKIKMKL
jgi:hypothetical protein